MDRATFSVWMDHSDALRLRELLADRPALRVSESRPWWFFGRIFSITGHPQTVERFKRDFEDAKWNWWLDRQ